MNEFRPVIVLTTSPERMDEWAQMIKYIRARFAEPFQQPLEQIVVLSRCRPGKNVDFHEIADDCDRGAAVVARHLKEHGRIACLVDGVQMQDMNPVGHAMAWSVLIARLILMFPEVDWFLIPERHGDDCRLENELGLEPLFKPQADPLFDSRGLREWVRSRARDAAIAGYLPRRNWLAVALDEERAYAYFHAYTAYRFGWRATAIHRGALAEQLLRPPAVKPELVLEDIYISFPDWGRGLSNLRTRAESWSHLEAERRVFVTTGQQLRDNRNRREDNEAYIGEQQARTRVGVVHKPHAGVFDLWRRAGLTKRPPRAAGTKSPSPRGYAAGFVPLISRQDESFDGNGEDYGHSSPGVLLAIAENLLSRAEELLPEVKSVEKAVRGAVLATDALELLGGRTPTVSVEALRLKHAFEVLAECQFSGVEHHVGLKDRFTEIRRDVKSISHWFRRRQRKIAAVNSEMHILLGLVKVFQEYGQFDEGQACINRIRRLHNTMWIRESPLRLPMWPVLRYLELLLSSFGVFCLTLLAWIVTLAVAYNWASRHADYSWGVFDALTSFFSIGGPIHPSGPGADDHSTFELAVITTAIISGFFHLGVFVSHLYAIVSRK